MAEYYALKARYLEFQKLVPVSSVVEIKSDSLARIVGTFSKFYPNEIPRSSGNYTSKVFKGIISIDFVLRESGEQIGFSSNYSGISGKMGYDSFSAYLGAIGPEDQIEVVMRKVTGSKRDNVLHMWLGSGVCYLRGPRTADPLERLSDAMVKDLGIK